MWAKIWAFIQVIREAIKAFNQIRIWVKENKKNEIDKKASDRSEALEDLRNAKTKEEFVEAQKRIAKSMD